MSITVERATEVTTTVAGSAAWQDAAPWVVTGVAALGELLAARRLCAGNPASNSGTAYANAVFSLAPGCFQVGALVVRWNRHVGSNGVQNRSCGREEWSALVARCRASVPAA